MEELERLSENEEFRVLYYAEKMRRKEEEKIAIAKNFLKKGVSLDIVSESTGLSVEELEKLEKEV